MSASREWREISKIERTYLASKCAAKLLMSIKLQITRQKVTDVQRILIFKDSKLFSCTAKVRKCTNVHTSKSTNNSGL